MKITKKMGCAIIYMLFVLAAIIHGSITDLSNLLLILFPIFCFAGWHIKERWSINITKGGVCGIIFGFIVLAIIINVAIEDLSNLWFIFLPIFCFAGLYIKERWSISITKGGACAIIFGLLALSGFLLNLSRGEYGVLIIPLCYIVVFGGGFAVYVMMEKVKADKEEEERKWRKRYW